MKSVKNNARWIWADVVPLIVIATIIIIVLFCYPAQSKHYSDAVTDMMSGWQTKEGALLSLDNLPKGDCTLKYSVAGLDFVNKRLCMRSSDTFLRVYADGVLTYVYEPEQLRVIGDSYGIYIHMILIPPGTKEITLKLHPIFPDISPYLKNAAIEDAGMFIGDVFATGLPGFCICMLMIIYGLLMLYMGITSKQPGENGTLNFLSLGTFSALVGLWSANDTCILQVLTQCPEIIKLLTYVCLIFIAYLPVSFIASATNQNNTKLLPVLMVLITVNFVLTFVLTYLDISDLHYMLRLSHVIIVIAMIMTIYLICRAAVRKTVEKDFIMRIVIGLCAAIIGVSTDLLRYKINHNSITSASVFTRIGVLVFIAMVGVHLIKERNKLAVEKGQAELMAKMAYTDGLTELHNRAAFHEKEHTIRNERIPCIIVQLDINNLKTVNDVYGHAEGDRHIITAANIIRDSFENIGTCYRTGGDEFIVVVDRGEIPQTEMAIGQMQRSTDAYNETKHPHVSLQIAYGYAAYTPQGDQLEVAEQLADQRMYEKKRKMKESK